MRLKNLLCQHKRLAVASGAIVCVLGTVFILFVLSDGQLQERESVSYVETDFEFGSSEGVAPIDGLNVEQHSVDIAFEENLWQVCPVHEWSENFSVNEGSPKISEECLSAFGEYMKREPKVLGRNNILQLVHFDAPMTYERIFRDPYGDREKVLEALSRPECQFADGELTPRWDLQETCHADAFANYFNILRVCRTGGAYLQNWLIFGGEDRVVFDPRPIEFGSEHKQKVWDRLAEEDRRSLLKTHLEASWVFDQCERSGLSYLNFEPEGADIDLYQKLSVVGERINGPNRYSWSDEGLAQLYLLGIAAHLGDEWATHEYRGPHRSRLGWFHYVETHHPWRIETEHLKEFQSKPLSVQQVIDAVDLVFALEDDEVSFDWKYLVDALCRYTPEESGTSTNCQAVIEQLDHTLDPVIHQRYLSVLAKFRSVALELDVYRNPSEKRIEFVLYSPL
ncbi:MAG: hypothetical protein F4077_08405 [Gammaproteobacteria bacterium]|nr:hypothetical protein [Gammaproteobacteria bacterium]